MYYWRDEDFSILTEASRIASANHAWSEYAKYCEMLEKGLRKEAFSHLSKFTESSARWSFSEKKKFVSWLYHYAYPKRFLNSLLPHPLRVNFLEPTLVEWICREPENSEPHRWLLGLEHLQEAVRLEPSDEIACYLLTNTILGHVGYSIDELPAGYIGNPKEDLILLQEAESAMSGVPDAEEKLEYLFEIAEMKESIYRYLSGSAEI